MGREGRIYKDGEGGEGCGGVVVCDYDHGDDG